MSRIKVHILNFWEIFHSHSEIVLEQQSPQGTLYYRIDPWSVPKETAIINDAACLKALNNASESQTILIDAEFSVLINAWSDKYKEECFTCCVNNCADVTAWFLENFVNIPNPGSWGSPVTLNHFFCGFFVPSFLQCCTLPGRVFDYAKESQHGEDEKLLKI